MDKELTALKELGKIRLVLSQSEQIFNDIFATNKDPIAPTLKNIKDVIKKIPVIETALKRNVELEKELCVVKTMEDLTIEAIKDKKLKALDIIREKRVDCNTLIFYLKKHNETGHIDYAFNSYNDYAKDSDKPQLTKEEFDSLKEVLL